MKKERSTVTSFFPLSLILIKALSWTPNPGHEPRSGANSGRALSHLQLERRLREYEGLRYLKSELQMPHAFTYQLERKPARRGRSLQSLEFEPQPHRVEPGRRHSPHPFPRAPPSAGPLCPAAERFPFRAGKRACWLSPGFPVSRLQSLKTGSLVSHAGTQSPRPGAHQAVPGGGCGRPLQETAQRPWVRPLGLDAGGLCVGGPGSSLGPPPSSCWFADSHW